MLLTMIMTLTASAEAAIIVSFDPTGMAATPVSIGVGQTTSVHLYMVWDGNGTNFLDAPKGLLTAGVNVNYSPSGILSVTAGSPAAGWDPFLSGITADDINGIAAVSTTVGFGDPPVTGTTFVEIATLQFQGMSIGTANLTLSDLLPDPSVDTLTIDGDYLDDPFAVAPDILDFSATLQINVAGTITAVPEPCSISMLSLAVCGACWHRRRKRIVGSAPNGFSDAG